MNSASKLLGLTSHTRIVPALTLLIGISSANDRHFTYNYETAVLAPGARELEVSNTLGVGRSDYYAKLDHRLEFEVGLCLHSGVGGFRETKRGVCSSCRPDGSKA